MVAGAEKGDHNIKKIEMFGGDLAKERVFHENLAQMKEKFLRNMYNITKKKEHLLFGNKMNKLVSLVRKASKDSVINELVYEIDLSLMTKLRDVQKKLEFVSRGNDAELTTELEKLYADFETQDEIAKKKRKIGLLEKSLEL